MAERLASVSTSITGLRGEAAAVLTLRSTGCTVEWDGGMTRGGDMRASSPSGIPLHLQVETSPAVDGRIAWKKEGQPARDWATLVEQHGVTPLYVFVHFLTPAAASVDLEARSLTVTMPSNFLVTATTAAQFADDVTLRESSTANVYASEMTASGGLVNCTAQRRCFAVPDDCRSVRPDERVSGEPCVIAVQHGGCTGVSRVGLNGQVNSRRLWP